jgi:flagellar biosynthesis protein FlhB
MEGFTQFCVWFLFVCAVIELSWKGWNKYKDYKEIKPETKPETKDKELEEEKKNKD